LSGSAGQSQTAQAERQEPPPRTFPALELAIAALPNGLLSVPVPELLGMDTLTPRTSSHGPRIAHKRTSDCLHEPTYRDNVPGHAASRPLAGQGL